MLAPYLTKKIMKNRKNYEIITLDKKERGSGFVILKTLNGEIQDKNLYDTLEEAQAELNRLNNTYYLFDYTNEEIEEWFNKINFQTLWDFINDLLKLKLTFNIKTKNDRWGKTAYFKYMSNEDLTEFSHLLKVVFKEVRVENFNASINVKKETGELYIHTTICYGYSHYDGGTNASQFASAWYSEKDGWKIEAEMNE